MATSDPRYKLIYSNTDGSLVKVIEIRDASGNVLATPIVHLPTDGDWATFIASLGTCTVPGTEDNIRCVCLCDDTNDDGSNIVKFIRIVAINVASGTASVVGDFTLDYSSNYTTQGTVSVCSDIGSPVVGVNQGRELITSPSGWSRPSVLLQSLAVRVVAIGDSGNPPTITDYRSVQSDLFVSDSFERWESLIDNGANVLTGNFTINTNSGDKVIVTWTELTT